MIIEKLRFDTGIDDSILHDRELLLTCLQQPFIYIRIPRTGSTSISKMLRDNNAWPHFYASLIKDLIGEDNYNSRVTFASVRNPWDRMVSWFMFNCNDYRADPEQSKKYKELGFKGWIMEGCPHRGWSPHHYAHQPQDPISQLSWIVDKENNIIVDHIVRLESLQQDFEAIRHKLGLNRIMIPRLNTSTKRQFSDYRKYYDWETKEKVREMYREDVRFFKYEF
jgi:hypothetical protein